MDKFEAIKFRYDQARAMGSTSTAVQDIGQLLNELNRRQAALDAAEQRAAEAEGQLAEGKKLINRLIWEPINVLTDEGGLQLCPWCEGLLNHKHTHQKNCPRQAAAKLLEEHGPHEHG